jgi:hypothetical protein
MAVSRQCILSGTGARADSHCVDSPAVLPGGHLSHPLLPPLTLETAETRVQAAEDAWRTRDPERVAEAYTPGHPVAEPRRALRGEGCGDRLPDPQVADGAKLLTSSPARRRPRRLASREQAWRSSALGRLESRGRWTGSGTPWTWTGCCVGCWLTPVGASGSSGPCSGWSPSGRSSQHASHRRVAVEAHPHQRADRQSGPHRRR